MFSHELDRRPLSAHHAQPRHPARLDPDGCRRGRAGQRAHGAVPLRGAGRRFPRRCRSARRARARRAAARIRHRASGRLSPLCVRQRRLGDTSPSTSFLVTSLALARRGRHLSADAAPRRGDAAQPAAHGRGAVDRAARGARLSVRRDRGRTEHQALGLQSLEPAAPAICRTRSTSAGRARSSTSISPEDLTRNMAPAHAVPVAGRHGRQGTLAAALRASSSPA